MKKNYNAPAFELMAFAEEDVITASFTGNAINYEDANSEIDLPSVFSWLG